MSLRARARRSFLRAVLVNFAVSFFFWPALSQYLAVPTEVFEPRPYRAAVAEETRRLRRAVHERVQRTLSRTPLSSAPGRKPAVGRQKVAEVLMPGSVGAVRDSLLSPATFCARTSKAYFVERFRLLKVLLRSAAPATTDPPPIAGDELIL